MSDYTLDRYLLHRQLEFSNVNDFAYNLIAESESKIEKFNADLSGTNFSRVNNGVLNDIANRRGYAFLDKRLGESLLSENSFALAHNLHAYIVAYRTISNAMMKSQDLQTMRHFIVVQNKLGEFIKKAEEPPF